VFNATEVLENWEGEEGVGRDEPSFDFSSMHEELDDVPLDSIQI